MQPLSRRAVETVQAAVLLAVVLLSWSFVIYAGRLAAHWQLEERTALLQPD